MELTALNILLFLGATWRMASLLANEGGPADIFAKIRWCFDWCSDHSKLFYATKLQEGVRCEWCNSIWCGAVNMIMWYFVGDIMLYAWLILTASSYAIMFKYVLQSFQALEQVLLKKSA